MAAMASLRLRDFGKHLEDVDHAVPDLQFDIDAGGQRPVRQHGGIVAHGFAIAGMDQQRRQAGEIGVERRDQRIEGSPSSRR